MYRNGQQVLTHKEHDFLLNHGALGDIITSLPAIIHARRTVSTDMVMRAYVPGWQVELIDHLLKPYGPIEVKDIGGFPLKAAQREDYNGPSNSLNAALYNTHTRNRVHMTDYAFSFLLDARPENMAQRNYPTAAPLGERKIAEKYVVFPVGATSDNKLFKASVMGPVLQWCQERGYATVLVGTKASRTLAEGPGGTTEKLVIRDEVDRLPADVFAKCVDMREKTTLLELRDLCGYAEAVVTVDGGTTHLAGTTDTNIIYAMGTTLPTHRYIPRNGDPNHKIRYIIPRNLECHGCQSRWSLTRWDFRFCAYQDNACMTALHPDDFVDGLKELGL